MTTLPTPAAFLTHHRRRAPLARLFMTVCETRFLDGPVCVATLPARQLFHGTLEGFLVQRLPSEGGGYCAALDCVEVK